MVMNKSEGSHLMLELPFSLWLFNIAMENGPFTDDFPSYKPPFIMDFP
jgi:hypothetical protein